MGVDRPTVSERIYADGWYELTESGVSSLKTGSTAMAYASYSFFTNNSLYYPTAYKGIRFHFGTISSAYAEHYRVVGQSDQKAYVTGITANFSGALPSGSFSAYPLEIYEGSPYNSANLMFRPGQYNYPISGYITVSSSYNTDNYQCVSGGCTQNLYINTQYSGTATISFSGNTGSNPPYQEIQWQRCDPIIKSSAPQSGSFQEESTDHVFSWNIDALTSYSGNIVNPTEIYFLWGTDTSTSNEVAVSGVKTSVTIPGNTFPSQATVYWRVRYKNPIDGSTNYTEIRNFTTIDATPTVRNLAPVNSSIDGEVDNTFTWEYQINTGSAQKAFDLQISNNEGSSWENLYSHELSSNTQAVIPSGTFIAGTGLWKVRVYNTDDIASEWSDPATLIVRAAPEAPIISKVTDTPKITVDWQSTGQQAFQVIANDIDSGVVFGTGKTYTIPYYFRDGGTVNIKVRIKNRFSEWSEWSEISVTVENTSTGNITALAQNVGNDVKLTWATETEFVCFYVLRGGIPIAKTTDLKEYTDYTSVGANEYQIMGITADGYYTLSNVVPVSVLPQTAVIGILSNTVSWVTLTYRRGNLPEIITSSSEEVYYQYYSGRKLPVAYSSRFKTKKKTLNFTVYKQDADAIENMIGQTVIYKDYAENKIIGIVNDVETSSYANRPDVRMEITAIDYLEDVGYD